MELVCARPPVSSYDFMRYLCAALVKQSKVIIDLDSIIARIYNCLLYTSGLSSVRGKWNEAFCISVG